MNVTHKQLKIFVAVAQTQSFADACSLVHLSQPAISIAIKNLEDEVGGALFVRTTRAVSLTSEGESFYPVARRLLADWENAIEALHTQFLAGRARLAIAAMPSYAGNQLPEVLAKFQKINTGINISVDDVIAEQVVSYVLQGRVELGICFEPAIHDELKFQPLFEDRFILVMSSEDPLSKYEEITWEHMAHRNFILLQRPSSIRALIDQVMQKQGYELSVINEAHQLVTVGRMVSEGMGISIVPKLCQEQFEEMGVVCKPIFGLDISRNVGMLTRKQIPLSNGASQLKSILVSHYSGEG